MASFDALPPELLDLVAMNLGLSEYLQLGETCRKLRRIFSHKILSSLIDDIKRMKGDELNNLLRTFPLDQFHYISLCHVLSYVYRKNGLTSHLEVLVERGASLKYVPCGDLVEDAAQWYDYESRLSWLTQHGASYREVPGGIDRLCCEAYEQGDFAKFRWLFSKGASLDILAGVVFDFSGCHKPRTPEACRYHLLPLKRALREGAKPSGSHETLTAELRLRQRKGLSDGWGKSTS